VTITKSSPYSSGEIKKLSEEFEIYIKTVMDIENGICCAGVNLHVDGEQILLEQGSLQKNIWGGGIDLTTKSIDFNSFINIRPTTGNPSNEIIVPEIRQKYEELTKSFFKVLYE